MRLEAYPLDNAWEFTQVRPPQTTVAYLKFPGSKSHYRWGALTEVERDERDFMVESGYGMSMKLPGLITDATCAKFKRMMRILGLKPSLDQSQKGLDLSVEDSSNDVAEDTSKDRMGPSPGPKSSTPAEPQLTMLLRTTTRYDEHED